jgi:acyl carrier protein
MGRDEILETMKAILAKQGKQATLSEGATLREVGFRSLDFSELALRVEMASGKNLDFDAGKLRQVQTVGDVLDFFVDAAG